MTYNTYHNMETYIAQKIKMLRKDFNIRLTKAEIKHMKSLQTKISVDNYARTLISNKL